MVGAFFPLVKFKQSRSIKKQVHIALRLSSITSSANEVLQSLSNSRVSKKEKSVNFNPVFLSFSKEMVTLMGFESFKGLSNFNRPLKYVPVSFVIISCFCQIYKKQRKLELLLKQVILIR